MGATSSKTISSITNEVAAEVIMKSMQNCTSISEQSQTMNVTGWAIGNSQTQKATLNLSCAGNFKMTADVSNQIVSEIQQRAAAEGLAMLTATNSEADSRMRNLVSSKITTEVVQNSIAMVKQSQGMNVSGVGIGNAQTQDSDMVQQALMTSINNTGISTDMQQFVDQSATAVTKSPFAFLTDWMQMGFWFILILFAIIIGSILYIFSD